MAIISTDNSVDYLRELITNGRLQPAKNDRRNILANCLQPAAEGLLAVAERSRQLESPVVKLVSALPRRQAGKGLQSPFSVYPPDTDKVVLLTQDAIRKSDLLIPYDCHVEFDSHPLGALGIKAVALADRRNSLHWPEPSLLLALELRERGVASPLWEQGFVMVRVGLNGWFGSAGYHPWSSDSLFLDKMLGLDDSSLPSFWQSPRFNGNDHTIGFPMATSYLMTHLPEIGNWLTTWANGIN